MSRYREISPAEMTPAQKQVHDEIVAGKRGRFGGPFQLLIRAPEVCRASVATRRVFALGQLAAAGAVRTGDLLNRRAASGQITSGTHMRRWPTRPGCRQPRSKQSARGAAPNFAARTQALVYRIVTELIDTKRLSDATFAEAIAAFGEQGVSNSVRSSATTRRLGTRSTSSRSRCPRGAPHPSRNRDDDAAAHAACGRPRSKQFGQTAGEGRRVGQLLALDDPRLVEQQPGELPKLVRGAGFADSRGEALDQFVARVQFEDSLGRGVELAMLLQQPLEMHVHIALVGDQTDGAVGQPLRAAHVLDRVAERQFEDRDQAGELGRRRRLFAAAALRAPRSYRDRRRRGSPI